MTREFGPKLNVFVSPPSGSWSGHKPDQLSPQLGTPLSKWFYEQKSGLLCCSNNLSIIYNTIISNNITTKIINNLLQSIL